MIYETLSRDALLNIKVYLTLILFLTSHSFRHSVYHSLYFSICQYVYMFISMSVCLFVFLSVSLFVNRFASKDNLSLIVLQVLARKRRALARSIFPLFIREAAKKFLR